MPSSRWGIEGQLQWVVDSVGRLLGYKDERGNVYKVPNALHVPSIEDLTNADEPNESSGATVQQTASGPAIALTATSAGKRQAVGLARSLSLTCAAGGSIYYRFTDASAAVAVSSSDATAAMTTAPVLIAVPAGFPYIEYLRVGGADVLFTAQPMV